MSVHTRASVRNSSFKVGSLMSLRLYSVTKFLQEADCRYPLNSHIGECAPSYEQGAALFRKGAISRSHYILSTEMNDTVPSWGSATRCFTEIALDHRDFPKIALG